MSPQRSNEAGARYGIDSTRFVLVSAVVLPASAVILFVVIWSFRRIDMLVDHHTARRIIESLIRNGFLCRATEEVFEPV
jgi:hypothetical protein